MRVSSPVVNPSSVTCTGNVSKAKALPLIKRYLASIERPSGEGAVPWGMYMHMYSTRSLIRRHQGITCP